MLSCGCNEWEGDFGTWAFYPPDNFELFSSKRRKRCSSCNQLITIGDNCLKFSRVRAPYTEIEQRISGDEISKAALFLCEKCGEIYLNLTEIGYCLCPTEEMAEALEEYWELTGFSPERVEL